MKKLIIFPVLLLLALSAQAKKSAPAAEAAPADTVVAADSVAPLKLRANALYRVMRCETVIHSTPRADTDQRKTDKELLTVERGDTLEADPSTQAYLDAHAADGFQMLPVVYKGMRGYAYADALMPARAEAGDSIFPIVAESPAEMAALPRSLVEWRERAMNLPVEPSQWMWLIIGSLVVAGIVAAITPVWRPMVYVAYLMGPVCLIITSVAEIGYLLAMDQHALSFFSPKCVGWWMAILGFVGMAVVLIAQYFLFSICWELLGTGYSFLDSGNAPHDRSRAKKTFNFFIAWPAILAVVSLVLVLVDSFTGNTWDIRFHSWAYLTIPVCALIAAVCACVMRRPLAAIVAIPFYILAIPGLAVSLSILGLYLLIFAVIALVVGAIGGAIFGGASSSGGSSGRRSSGGGGGGSRSSSGAGPLGGMKIHGKPIRVKFRTPDGRIIWGTRDLEMKDLVRGDDGKYYDLIDNK